MGNRISRYEEVVVWVMPIPGQTFEDQSTGTPVPASGTTGVGNVFQRISKWFGSFFAPHDLKEAQSYDAWVYTNLDIPGLDASQITDIEGAPEVNNLRLAKHERVIIHWEHYKEYLDTFIKGNKADANGFWNSSSSTEQQDAISAMRDKLFELSSPELKSLFCEKAELSNRPIRVWWHCTPPELADLPWELLACEARKKGKTKFSFVRGIPPERPQPKTQVEGRLRLAFIHDPDSTPEYIKSAIEELKSTLDITEMTTPSPESLRLAAKEGVELIHLVTDGALSLGNEGLLYFKSTTATSKTDELTPTQRRMYRLALNYSSYLRPLKLINDERLLEWNNRLTRKLDIKECSASELSAALRGSRVTLLSLSTPQTDYFDPSSLDAKLPSVYRAFANLAGSTLPLPNIVAPLGNERDEVLKKFWGSFYRQLATPECYSIEEAAAFGLQEAPNAIMALFMRQRLGREFTNRSVKIGEAGGEEPALVNAQLHVARSLIEQLRAIDENYKDIESNIAETPLVKCETARQSKLEEEIATLTELEEETS